ncbi:methyl-CpG-binding domain-containing protein 4-like isoform 1 [Hibiscus syriacus]|uniref:Methyl-CpG-binding domain-containing protein 4-like isoform 1 n=1 Tax=Hibiscus syriacus TaxID=106335 RepID=A0A6A2YKY6_HIBSY|nr:probable indole-3-acetic acid-amido synthetase GH3.6 [Hibiscus syriacus]KAE8679617.1 methyl-CpG-binding domain-containing protein 4-like isoform 1 [Hibiscus syriacus]
MTDDALLKQIEESTKDFSRHQADTLRSILQHQRGVHYLQRYLPDIGDRYLPIDAATFRCSVPLSCYDDYVDYINQLANGDNYSDDHDPPHILSVDRLVCFFYSSGTTSMKPKLIPYFDSALSKAASYIAHQGSAVVLRRFFPPRPEVNQRLAFIYADSITTTKGGFKVMAASSFPFHNSSNANYSLFMSFASPMEVILGSNVEHQLYCHLLCGLRNSDSIDAIHAPYALGLIRAFRALESKWEQLCNDIEKGFPCSEINDVRMRDSVVEVLSGPQPYLSNRIRLIFEKKDWGGILHKLWPNVRYIRCVTTGSMKQYYSKLKHFAGEVPLVGGDYFSSECPVAINLDIKQPPDQTRFVMLPTTGYFEFLPFNSTENEVVIGEETVYVCGVEVGKMYEVVVTTYRGFYRYRLGDIVRVVGFYNTSPLLEFVMRAPKTSFEIVTEGDLMAAMESFQLVIRNTMGLAIEIVDFTSSIDFDCSPKRLKIFIEAQDCDTILQEKLRGSDLRKCCSAVEDGLGSIYKVQRNNGEISPLSLSILNCGSFDRLLKLAIENGTPASQYKSPKIIRNPSIVDVLEEYVLVNITLD